MDHERVGRKLRPLGASETTMQRTIFALIAFAWYAKDNGRETLLNLYPPFFKTLVIPFGSMELGGVAIYVNGDEVTALGTLEYSQSTGKIPLDAGTYDMVGNLDEWVETKSGGFAGGAEQQCQGQKTICVLEYLVDFNP